MEIESNKRIRFSPKPLAVSINYRMHTKLALIVFILKVNSNSSKSSALKLQFFIWALKNQNNIDRVRELVSSNFKSEIEFWGLEPALSRALTYATSEGLIAIDNGMYVLIKKGEEYYKMIQKEPDVLPVEKAFLTAIGKRISNTRLNKIAVWAQKNAEN